AIDVVDDGHRLGRRGGRPRQREHGGQQAGHRTHGALTRLVPFQLVSPSEAWLSALYLCPIQRGVPGEEGDILECALPPHSPRFGATSWNGTSGLRDRPCDRPAPTGHARA